MSTLTLPFLGFSFNSCILIYIICKVTLCNYICIYLLFSLFCSKRPLLYGLATEMKKKLDSVKISFTKQQLDNKT